jgi:hypothetical protein
LSRNTTLTRFRPESIFRAEPVKCDSDPELSAILSVARAVGLSIRHRGAAELGTIEGRAGDVRAGEIGAEQIGTREFRAGEIGAGQIRAGQIRIDKVAPREIGAGQVRADELRARQSRARQIGAREVSYRRMLVTEGIRRQRFELAIRGPRFRR